MNADGQIRQHERERGGCFRLVAQAVSDDGGGHGEHQEEIEFARIDDLRRGDMVDGIADEIEKRPASGSASTSQNAIAFVGFVANTDGNHDRAQTDAEENLAAGSEILELIGEEEGQAQHQNADADFVQPVRAQHFLQVEPARGWLARFRLGKHGRRHSRRRWSGRERIAGRGGGVAMAAQFWVRAPAAGFQAAWPRGSCGNRRRRRRSIVRVPLSTGADSSRLHGARQAFRAGLRGALRELRLASLFALLFLEARLENI